MSGHMIQLKRVAWFLQGVPRMAQQHFAQEKSLEVHVDSDCAGDMKHDWSDHDLWIQFHSSKREWSK